MSRCPHPPAKILRACIEALTRFSHVWQAGGPSHTLLAQGCIVENGFHCANSGQNTNSKDRERWGASNCLGQAPGSTVVTLSHDLLQHILSDYANPKVTFMSVNMSISFGYKIKLCAGHIAYWLKLVLKIYHFIIMLVRKKRKNSFLAGATVWNLYILLLSVWVFCGDSGFFPHPKDVHVWWTGVSTLSHSEWVCVQVWVCPVMEGCPVQGPTLIQGEALATHDPELE